MSDRHFEVGKFYRKAGNQARVVRECVMVREFGTGDEATEYGLMVWLNESDRTPCAKWIWQPALQHGWQVECDSSGKVTGVDHERD